MFPIHHDGGLLFPSDISLLYDAAIDLASAADRRNKLPGDIRLNLNNALGFIRRIPGQPYHREACNGRDDTPTKSEIIAAYSQLLTTCKRLRSALGSEVV